MEGTSFFFVPFTLLAVLTLSWVKFCEKRSPATVGLPRAGASIGYLSGFGLGLAFAGRSSARWPWRCVTCNLPGPAPRKRSPCDVLVMLAAYIVQAGPKNCSSGMVHAGSRRPLPALDRSACFLRPVPSCPRSVESGFAANLLLCGLFLALYSLRAGSIWGICGWHGAWNWTLANVFGLAVSGHEQPGVLFDLQAAGPELLTGGGYGPEASLVTTAVLLAGIAVVVATSRARSGGGSRCASERSPDGGLPGLIRTRDAARDRRTSTGGPDAGPPGLRTGGAVPCCSRSPIWSIV